MMNTTVKIEKVKNLVSGLWQESAGLEFSEAYNPSQGQIIAKVPHSTKEEMDTILLKAQDAQLGWGQKSVIERARVMFRYREILLERFDDIALTVCREHGKTLEEAKASLKRGIEMVEYATSAPHVLQGRTIENIATNIDAESTRHPIGVSLGICPFNFPVMVPMWMFPISLVCGNSFVLKPSEKVPLSAIKLGEALMDAGLPEGVFQIVQGGKEQVDYLIKHPIVKTISFVGSTPIARYIYQTGTAHGKRVQSAGGAKNHLVIMPDADMVQTANQIQSSAFGCAGERCMAGSVAVAVGDAADAFIDALGNKASVMTVGATDEGQQVDMGPVISELHRDRINGFLKDAIDYGADVVLDGSKVTGNGKGYFTGPSIIDNALPNMPIIKEEIFGPVLSVIRVKTLEDAINLGNKSPFGNGAAIFTQHGHVARAFKRHFQAGMLGVNVSVPAPMAWFTFSGWKESFFGDLHMQGEEGFLFFTQQKSIMTRWPEAIDSGQDAVWNTKL